MAPFKDLIDVLNKIVDENHIYDITKEPLMEIEHLTGIYNVLDSWIYIDEDSINILTNELKIEELI